MIKYIPLAWALLIVLKVVGVVTIGWFGVLFYPPIIVILAAIIVFLAVFLFGIVGLILFGK